MLERILGNLKTSAAGIAAAVITLAGVFGLDLSAYEAMLVSLLGIIGTVGLLLAKD